MAKKVTREVTDYQTQQPDEPARSSLPPEVQEAMKQYEKDNLTNQDLHVLGQAVDIAFQKGAFNAAQAAPIGTTFVKLQRYLEAVARKQQ